MAKDATEALMDYENNTTRTTMTMTIPTEKSVGVTGDW
jgi:hypothetical protein